MDIQFSPFNTFIQKNTTARTRDKYADSRIVKIDVQDCYIKARVRGTSTYSIEIYYDKFQVFDAHCTCPYDNGGYCKHIVNVLVNADRHLRSLDTQSFLFPEETTTELNITKKDKTFTLANSDILTTPQLSSNTFPKSRRYNAVRMNLHAAQYNINELNGKIIAYQGYQVQNLNISIVQQDNDLLLTCDCSNDSNRICEHLDFAVSEIKREKLLQLPFNVSERHKILANKAKEDGWSEIKDYDTFFKIYMEGKKIHIAPRINVLSYNQFLTSRFKERIFPGINLPTETKEEFQEFIIIERQPYQDYFKFSLAQSKVTKNGTMKAPVTFNNSLQTRVKRAQSNEEIAFYSSLMMGNSEDKRSLGIDYYKDIIKNPLGLEFFLLLPARYSDKINLKHLHSYRLQQSPISIKISVKEDGDYYRIECHIEVERKMIAYHEVELFDYIFTYKETLYCLNKESERNVLRFFEENGSHVFIQKHQLESFQSEFLGPLENIVTVSYSFIKPASKTMIKQNGFDQINKQLIYLSELNDFILITPAVAYGDTEIPLLSKRTLYIKQADGTCYDAERDNLLEQKALDSIQAQHKSFSDVPQTEFYYLHKREFLDSGWFIDAFEAWRQAGFTILGFNKLRNNVYNQHKITVKNSLKSGIDWFDIETDISFGDQQVTLRQLQKSVLNKSRYIELSDGTQGILPQTWIEKFERYFRAGEIKEGSIRVHKSNFQLIDELFENEILTQDVQLELSQYRKKLAEFHSIQQVKVPIKLKAKLRDYQKEGLNWLNFLSEFNFGGCLADDMGLGKTIQIITYILSQHEKGNMAPNLVVLPTSLLFNWQKEIEKFAPHLKYVTLYGSGRNTAQLDVNKYHLVLTTYGTLLSDISFLKEQFFNIIVLDESQAIKNPESKRYKAVKLLNGRQRLVLTGTPVENNTFDLFAQLSFAMPGLLGTSKRFTTDYSTPIDKFQDSERAKELQQKIYPFVLRRTKKQVATELPPKTEIIHYCEMGDDQKRIYDAYKLEFQKYLTGLNEEDIQSSSLHILQGITKLRQICNSPSLLSDEEYYGEDSAKIKELIHQIKALKDAHKILVFSQFVEMLDLIKKQLEQADIGYTYLTGKTKNREHEVEQFQEDESVRVFLISLKAGGTGLNLTQAEYVFLVDPWWNPAVENQAIDRAYRIGQQHKVIAIRLITPDSIEEKIMELQQRKRQLADELIHTDNSILKSLKKNDLINLL
ncbi:SNF2-related protein [Sphingobacterium athyrii]|uniref:DNA helicase n=1 Tax=Sphingobacterium athyrii TaxID=2152717 RepID=A0A363NNI1_9SPHI|nr:SNF2-related protein [Sphingobacterium athyrii]PUV22313.1 DNA helicase [Sphingobacterium athyrii]